MPLDPTIGQIIHSVIIDDLHIETDGWAVECVERVADRLIVLDEVPDNFRFEVVWLDGYRAFTTPGQYVYISRRLLERCSTDDSVAFVLAHEVSHHILGHFDNLPDWILDSTGKEFAFLAAALYRGLERFVCGPESETDADELALKLCQLAGFDGHKCLQVFDVLEHRALDKGDISGVFGPDEDEIDTTGERFQKWLLERIHGHPPLRVRKELLENQLLDESSGTKSAT